MIKTEAVSQIGQEKLIKMDDNKNDEPLRPPPETPRIMRVFRDQLSQSAPGSPSIFSLDPELVTEVEKQYFSQSEELRLLKVVKNFIIFSVPLQPHYRPIHSY